MDDKSNLSELFERVQNGDQDAINFMRQIDPATMAMREQLKVNRLRGKGREDYITCMLQDFFTDVQTNVKCEAGCIDAIADGYLIEIKSNLSRENIQRGIGQLVLYNACLGYQYKPVMAIWVEPERMPKAQYWIDLLGKANIEMWIPTARDDGSEYLWSSFGGHHG